MTVYSGVLSRPLQIKDKHRAVSVKIENATILKLNLVLLFIAAVTIVAYVFISNLLVAQKYALNLRKSELSQLNAKLTVEDRYGGGELEVLFRFAQNHGLIEAKDTDSILEKDGFAILP